jgi:hypothetical protein
VLRMSSRASNRAPYGDSPNDSRAGVNFCAFSASWHLRLAVRTRTVTDDRDTNPTKFDWQFTTKGAHTRLKLLYPFNFNPTEWVTSASAHGPSPQCCLNRDDPNRFRHPSQ